jgi:hypothetical protein
MIIGLVQDDKLEEVKCVIPDRCYSSMYAAIIQDCKYVQYIYLEEGGWGMELAGEGEVCDTPYLTGAAHPCLPPSSRTASTYNIYIGGRGWVLELVGGGEVCDT